MLECQIIGRTVGSLERRPIGRPEWLATNSASCPWRDSFKVERHIRPAHEQPEITLLETTVHFRTDKTKSPVDVEWRIGGTRLHRKPMRSGDVAVMTKDTPVWGRCLGRSEVILISFSTQFLENRAENPGSRRVEFENLRFTDDQRVRALGNLLELEARLGCPTGRIYGESIGTALAAHLLKRYAAAPSKAEKYTGGLSKYNLRRALDYIQSQLTRDVGLQQLASELDMSPFHFCRSFKQSTGLSPHQYVLRLRIEESKRLLRNGELSIAEVGSRVGFSDPSHFTMMFRKLLGTSPSQWRKLS
jgi:AraC family transcriptional regulator